MVLGLGTLPPFPLPVHGEGETLRFQWLFSKQSRRAGREVARGDLKRRGKA